jgi:hypothetical protein
MAIVFMMNEEIARGMVCFFHQKKHSYLIIMEHFYRVQQNLSSLHKIGWRPAEKNSPVFFHMNILDLDFYG